jgi:hypothetical protein
MAKKRQTTTAKKTAEGNAVYGESIIEPHKKTKHYVKDCPCDTLKSMTYCDKLPTDYVCENYECWSLALSIENNHFSTLDEEGKQLYVAAMTGITRTSTGIEVDENKEKAEST